MKIKNYDTLEHIFDAWSKTGRKHDNISVRRAGIAQRRRARKGNIRGITRKRARILAGYYGI